MLPSVEHLRKEYQSKLHTLKTLDHVNNFRVAWLGRKGRLTLLLKQLGSLPLAERKDRGAQYNALKAGLENALSHLEKTLTDAEQRKALDKEALDVSLPGVPRPYGHPHVLSTVMEDLVGIFQSLGFVCADGPEIESDFYNFAALNIPADHPARDLHDTFYLDPSRVLEQLPLPNLAQAPSPQGPTLLRTHTSPVQVRVMQTYPPPIAIVVPGRVYRHEAMDATHSAVFHQLEGLLVDEGVSFADLKDTLQRFARQFYGPAVKTRLRPSFFPFTEPSAEMDIACLLCEGSGCRVCKQSGWLEILGAGMVHPNVLAAVNIDSEKYTGFAFGMGVERLAMIKYGVDDLRLFYENDLRFLEQF